MFVVQNVAKMIVNIVIYSTSKFYSRIIIKKLSIGQLMHIRRMEDVLKSYIRKKADITYLE